MTMRTRSSSNIKLIIALLLLVSNQGVLGADGPRFRVRAKYSEFGDIDPLQGAKVECYEFIDRPNNKGKVITDTIRTNEDGRAKLKLSKHSGNIGKGDKVYCVISGKNLLTVHTPTQKLKSDDEVVNFGTFTIGPDRVARGDCGIYNGCGDFDRPDDVEFLNFAVQTIDACNNYDMCYQNCEETQESCDEEWRIQSYQGCYTEYDSKIGVKFCQTLTDVLTKYFVLFGTFLPQGSEDWDYEYYQIFAGCQKAKGRKVDVSVDKLRRQAEREGQELGGEPCVRGDHDKTEDSQDTKDSQDNKRNNQDTKDSEDNKRKNRGN